MDWNKKIQIMTMVLLFLMFITFMIVLNNYGKELRNDPCTFCAKRMKGDILCTISSAGGTVSRLFSYNGSITDSEQRIHQSLKYPDIGWPVGKEENASGRDNQAA